LLFFLASPANSLSFITPLQGLPSSQHLETVFAAETVTYARPEDHAAVLPLRTEPSIHSNQSSLSTRESSTTTTSRSSHEDILGLQSALHKSASFPNPIPHKSTKDSNWIGLETANDEPFLVPAQTVSRAVSSAHLKTGLQTSHQQRKNELPQPKPRKYPVHSSSDQFISNRKYSVPSVSSNASKPSVRRVSSGNVRTALVPDESTAKYPKFELSKIDQDAVLTLGDAESQRGVQRHPAWKGNNICKSVLNEVKQLLDLRWNSFAPPSLGRGRVAPPPSKNGVTMVSWSQPLSSYLCRIKTKGKFFLQRLRTSSAYCRI